MGNFTSLLIAALPMANIGRKQARCLIYTWVAFLGTMVCGVSGSPLQCPPGGQYFDRHLGRSGRYACCSELCASGMLDALCNDKCPDYERDKVGYSPPSTTTLRDFLTPVVSTLLVIIVVGIIVVVVVRKRKAVWTRSLTSLCRPDRGEPQEEPTAVFHNDDNNGEGVVLDLDPDRRDDPQTDHPDGGVTQPFLNPGAARSLDLNPLDDPQALRLQTPQDEAAQLGQHSGTAESFRGVPDHPDVGQNCDLQGPGGVVAPVGRSTGESFRHGQRLGEGVRRASVGGNGQVLTMMTAEVQESKRPVPVEDGESGGELAVH